MMQHKTRRARSPIRGHQLIVTIAVFEGCSAPPVPEIRHVPTPVALAKPVDALFGRADEQGRWLRLREVTFATGKQFGWRIHLPCHQPVEFTETMTLPAPGDWTFDPSDLPETTISAHGTVATTHDYAPCIGGWIEHSWTLAPKDPQGPWEIRVAIPGYEPQIWHVRFAN